MLDHRDGPRRANSSHSLTGLVPGSHHQNEEWDTPVHHTHHYKGVVRIGNNGPAVHIKEMDLDSATDDEAEDADNDNTVVDISEV